ncbi:MAG: TerB family tellurite resistance protein [Polyangiaceae bacterium]|nr:TerB family tellurite resistance protein [Polyangiaceae bacterium]
MGLLAWLGLKQGGTYPNLDALLAELRRALPDDESVVLRYIAAVVALLVQVASADGRFTEREEQAIRELLTHIHGLKPADIDAVARGLEGKVSELTEEERALCVRELKAICDGRERVEVIRLLAKVAAADGKLTPAERAELRQVALDLAVPAEEIAAAENVAAENETS